MAKTITTLFPLEEEEKNRLYQNTDMYRWNQRIDQLTDQALHLQKEKKDLQEKLKEKEKQINSVQGKLKEKDRQINSVQEKLKEKEKQIDGVQEQLNEKDKQIKDLQEKIFAKERIICDMTKEISVLTVNKDYLTAKSNHYEKKLTALQERIDKQQEEMKRLTSAVRLCFGCMSKIDAHLKQCPVCGFDSETVQNAPFMPLGTELQEGNYIVGKKISNNAEGAKYIGFSKTMSTKVIISEFLPANICGRANGKKKTVIRSDREEQFQKLNEEFLSYYRRIAGLRELSAIAPIFDIFSENGVSYTVAEYYDAISLTEYISRRDGPIDWNTARPLFKPLITALSKFHAEEMGHYAVSPEHVVVTSSGQLRLTDFALKEMRQTGGFFEPELMDGCAAPEQYQEDGVLDEATDVYGFTATLFYALTGRLPENSNKRKPDGKLSIPTAVFKRLPQHVVSALADGLQVEKKRRIASFDDMAERLSSIPSNPSSSPLDMPTADTKETGRKKGLFGWFFRKE